MSDLLNKASLVLIPSGYKEDTVYSVVPSDGSGDLSFTRASNGTRVNSAGLVEVCPWNLLQYSEDFTNGYWNKGAASITANATTAPNGTTTADKFDEIATNDTHQLYNTFTGNTGVSTLFVYAKKAERSGLQITSDQATDPSAIFNLDTGVVYSSENCTAFIESVGNGWYKCGITYTIDQITSYPVFRTTDASFNVVYSGTASYGIFIWGAQLNIGSTAKPYFPTTDRLNVPRLTYQNGGGGCPSLLLEKQSTNIVLQSEDFSSTSWAKQNGSTVTANSVISPDGTQNADTLNVSTTAYSSLYNTSPYSALTAIYTQSIYAKKGTKNWFYILDLGGSGAVAWFNLDTGVVGTVSSGYTATMQSAGNGWYRCILTENSNRLPLYLQFGASDSNNSFTPSSSGTVYVWGAQLEASSYPTSYIPTTSASATRVADACFKTGISSLIGQTEGVLFLDYNKIDANSTTFFSVANSIGSGAYLNSFYFLDIPNNTLVCDGYNGSAQFSFNYGGPLPVGRHKIALAYKANDFAWYVDGVLKGTDTNGSVPPLSAIEFNGVDGTSNNFMNSTNQVCLFKTRLTNAELASLTTI
jgi:hypothetical protein